MSKDKTLGPDGWTVDLFLYFFDIMGKDIIGGSRRFKEEELCFR